MSEKTFIQADEVAQELGMSLQFAYKLIKKLNAELMERGYITIAGRVSRKYFMEKMYGEGAGSEKGDQNERV